MNDENKEDGKKEKKPVDTGLTGKKFYLLKKGVLCTYWFALIVTFVLELTNQFLVFFKQIQSPLDLTNAWKFLTIFTWIAVGGILLYNGINVFQQIGYLKFGNGVPTEITPKDKK